MRALPLSLIFLLLWSKIAIAALTFPALTGRVVDDAHMLSAGTVWRLDQMLADYERGTSNQLVVVTLPSLQGHTIEDYGYQLGRYWQIGQKGKNNGALLIVAPQERKVRIEAGYGLEGTLTDAVCSEIIQGIILPNFRAGHMEQGVLDGTQAILTALGGQSVHAPQQQSAEDVSPLQGWLIIICLVLFVYFCIRHPLLAAILLSNSSSRFGSSGMGGGGFGRFSGGGGSFGGGGASGGW